MNSETVTIYVNERAVPVETGTDLLSAVGDVDPVLAAALAEGRAHVTDGVGREIPTSTPVAPGAIFRVVTSPPRTTS